ncbi:hypothetical protein [Paracoccus methylarcula]|uniref:Uncharacterized protein n=1 Tax=Paracoccus methylarcula TaxID=72022 RepID=A0A3R7SCX8_9RHOB|nr:hypothetical protein [Paracoccus methylarcula]RNF34775.1 hypothetical protein A7A09_010270 [Paracoccus methylarcula]
MSPIIRCLTTGTALAVLLTSSAMAEPAPASNSIFSPSNIAAGFLRMAVSYGRMIADIRYDALEIDPERGELVIRELTIAGLGPHANCRVSLGRMRLSGISIWGAENSHTRLDAGDISVANNCFGANAAMIGMVTGGDAIPVSDLAVDTRQSMGRGALIADIEINSPGIARIEGTADFDYVSFFAPGILQELVKDEQSSFLIDPEINEYPGTESDDTEEPTPEMGLRGTLRSAHLSVENLGLWERMQPMIPPDMLDPATIDNIVSAEPGTELHGIEQDLAETAKAFIAEPARVTAEIRPDQPIAFDSTEWETPLDAATLFKPGFSNALPTPPVALIVDPAGDGEDPRALGLALARGQGVPQNISRAIELLTPMQDDGEVALTLADLKTASDPAAAYAHALTAAETGTSGALSMLDRIEARMSTADLLAAQPAADSDLPDSVFASAVALRDAALAREEGAGAPRSYALAWRLASLAAAAGDSPARSLMARLDARFGADPAWIDIRDETADLALADWSEQDLANRLAAQ